MNRVVDVTGWTESEVMAQVREWAGKPVDWQGGREGACAILMNFSGQAGLISTGGAFYQVQNQVYLFENADEIPFGGEPRCYYIG